MWIRMMNYRVYHNSFIINKGSDVNISPTVKQILDGNFSNAYLYITSENWVSSSSSSSLPSASLGVNVVVPTELIGNFTNARITFSIDSTSHTRILHDSFRLVGGNNTVSYINAKKVDTIKDYVVESELTLPKDTEELSFLFSMNTSAIGELGRIFGVIVELYCPHISRKSVEVAGVGRIKLYKDTLIYVSPTLKICVGDEILRMGLVATHDIRASNIRFNTMSGVMAIAKELIPQVILADDISK